MGVSQNMNVKNITMNRRLHIHLMCMCVCPLVLGHVWLSVTLWTVALQTFLSMGFFRQEYWSGLPFPFSRGSCQPRDRTCISSTASRFLTRWAIMEALYWTTISFEKELLVRDKRKQALYLATKQDTILSNADAVECATFPGALSWGQSWAYICACWKSVPSSVNVGFRVGGVPLTHITYLPGCRQNPELLELLIFKQQCHVCVLSCRVLLFVTPWTAACQAPPSMGFSGQEYWSGLPCPPPRDLLDSGTELESLGRRVLHH